MARNALSVVLLAILITTLPVGGGVAYDGLPAPLLVLSKPGTRLPLPADLRPRQPHALGHVGQPPPVIPNLRAVHRILRSY